MEQESQLLWVQVQANFSCFPHQEMRLTSSLFVPPVNPAGDFLSQYAHTLLLSSFFYYPKGSFAPIWNTTQ